MHLFYAHERSSENLACEDKESGAKTDIKLSSFYISGFSKIIHKLLKINTLKYFCKSYFFIMCF